MAEHDMSVVNLSIAIFQQAADPVGAQYAASPPTSPFHWALALEDLHADSSHYSPSPSMKSVDYGGNSGSSSSDEDTDMPFAPSPAFQIPSPSSSSSSSPSPSPPPVHSSGHAPLGTAPVNLYHILNTKGSRWETSCQMGLRLGTVPSYVGSVDVARIRGIDMKDLDEFLAQFTAENPRPFGELQMFFFGFRYGAFSSLRLIMVSIPILSLLQFIRSHLGSLFPLHRLAVSFRSDSFLHSRSYRRWLVTPRQESGMQQYGQ